MVYLASGFFITDYRSALIMGVIVNTAECAAQLMIDTLVVERVYKETDDEGRGQSLAMAAKTSGTVVATCLSLILMLVFIPFIIHSRILSIFLLRSFSFLLVFLT